MEVLKDKIQKFLTTGFGTGDGFGYGFGYGNGTGFGTGDGKGEDTGIGYGAGQGRGNGYGAGYGEGQGRGYENGEGQGKGQGKGYSNGCISEINGNKVYMIDGVPTIIENVKGNLAKGYVLKNNVFPYPCYIAKVGNFFAHGDTVHEALIDATVKYEGNIPLEERIADTVKRYPTLDTVVSHQDLYELHHILTGSCRLGRNEFADAHNLDPHKGEMTMQEFIDLTRSAYGGENIIELEKAYKNR